MSPITARGSQMRRSVTLRARETQSICVEEKANCRWVVFQLLECALTYDTLSFMSIRAAFKHGIRQLILAFMRRVYLFLYTVSGESLTLQ